MPDGFWISDANSGVESTPKRKYIKDDIVDWAFTFHYVSQVGAQLKEDDTS